MTGADRHLAPGDPARPIGGGDLLVVAARAVGRERGQALLDHLGQIARADQRLAGAAGERAEGVIRVGDAALPVAAHDQVALRFEKAARALLGFPELPVAVGELLGVRAQRPKLALEVMLACNKKAGETECAARERGEHDCKRLRIERHDRSGPPQSGGRRDGDGGRSCVGSVAIPFRECAQASVRVDEEIMLPACSFLRSARAYRRSASQ